MLSEQGSQYITINSPLAFVNLSAFDIKLHSKNGMIYQMYSTYDQSLQYKLNDKTAQVIRER